MMIAENLERLKILDIETWKEIFQGIPLNPMGQYYSFDHGEVTAHQFKMVYLPFVQMLPEVGRIWIQDCIQRAITVRIDHEAEKSRETWSYEIIADRDGYKALVGPRDVRSFFEYGDSPAAALLAAYIEAMK
jgi:hypothetical protein